MRVEQFLCDDCGKEAHVTRHHGFDLCQTCREARLAHSFHVQTPGTKCSACDGRKGRREFHAGDAYNWHDCPRCNGTGREPLGGI